MLNKEQIITLLHQYNFDSKKYVVLSSAAMVLQNIKKSTKDIDISVTKDYYEYLLNNYSCTFEKESKFGRNVYFINNIINFGMDFYTKDYVLIEGIPVQKLEDVKKLKLFLNRDKDKKDIALIDKALNKK